MNRSRDASPARWSRLTGLETRWTVAALGAIFPGSREDGLADIRAMDIGGFLERLLVDLPLRAAIGLRVAIWLVALSPAFVVGKLTVLTRLSAVERERVVAALVSSRWYAVRSLVLILKALGALLYAGDGAVQARMRVPAGGRSPLVVLRTKPVHAA